MYKIKRRSASGLRRSRRGNMPFAIIAITLLILGSAYGVVAAQTEKSSDNAENITEEIGLIGEVIENTERFVERGLGEVIFTLSTSTFEGTVSERIEKYQDRANKWMDLQFPLTDSGVTVTLNSFSTELDIESLRDGEDDLSTGSAPSYLVGTGSFTAKYVCDSGTSITSSDFETDASCALPLVAEQGSLFKNAVSGSGSPITQMMSYQLTALAQYRVMNGYGALNEYGPNGTANIITSDDVKKAYSNSIKLLGLTYFREAPEGIDSATEYLDIADYFIAYDGHVEINISVIYSQALMSIADDLILQWMDYLYGNVVFDFIDSAGDVLANAWDSLKGFFKGTNEFSAAPYIENILKSSGLNVSEYRYLNSGKSFTVTIDQAYVSAIVGEEASSVSISVPYPSADLMSWNGITDFKKTYRGDNNELREWFAEIINRAALEIGDRKSFGTIRFSVNAMDDEAFMDTVAKNIASALNNSDTVYTNTMSASITSQVMIDPFYASIYEVIDTDRHSIYGVDGFESSIRSHLYDGLTSEIEDEYGTALDEDLINATVNAVMSSPQITGIVDSYTSAVDSLMTGFSALANVEKGKDGTLKKIIREIAKGGMNLGDMVTDVPGRINSICEETCSTLSINAYYGVTELPGKDCFEVTDSSGRTATETIDLDIISSPTIKINGPNANKDENIHYVGFFQNSGLSYCTMFSAEIRDTLVFTASSSNSLSGSMGVADSKIEDTCEIDLTIKIPVASSWKLVGVNAYNASNTLLGDAWTAILSILEPIMEPIKKIMDMIMDALNVLASAFIEAAKFVADIVERIYMALMEPLEQLRSIIENTLDSWFASMAEDFLDWIVKVNASQQTIGAKFMGFTIAVTLNLASLSKSTKTLATVSMETEVAGIDVYGAITIKQTGEGSSKKLLVTGACSLEGDDWNVSADVDPLMKSNKYLIAFSGLVNGIEFDLVLPELVKYNEIDVSVQDIPGVGTMLSNIPIGGAKLSFDIGLNLKYTAPFENGVVINEFESNPEGTDKGYEWVELFNASSESVDLDGYKICAGSSAAKVYVISGETIGPGGRLVIDLPGSFLNNAASNALKKGEYVQLFDSDGNSVDKTPAKKDTANDSYTWQRVSDGACEWVFEDGTPGTKNCGGLLTGVMVRTQLINIIKDSASETLGQMGTLLSTGDLAQFFQTATQNAVTSAIEMLSDCLVEASLYVSLDVTDPASAGCIGFEAYLMIDSDFMEDGLKCLVGEVEELLLNIENPYGLDPKTVIYDNTYLGIKVYTGMNTPGFLGDTDGYPEIQICVNIRTNLSAFDRVFGGCTGTWKVVCGVQILDCPYAVIPSALDPDKTMHNDLWLVKATFKSAE